MNREKGLAYCGLACCVCAQNDTCAGCRSDGCAGKEWCQNRSCCIEKGLRGCWECPEFPCSTGLLRKMRTRVFGQFVAAYGEEALLDRLEANEKAGLIYHYDNQIVGDYDLPDSEDGILRLIACGKAESTNGLRR
jgi:hypothetical protein